MPRTPIVATYRLQLRGPQADPESGRSFTFADAAQIVPYLTKLGISHLYLSPILTASPASTHGYDVINPTQVNPELGGLEGFRDLARTAHEAGLGIIVDIVPNHVGVENPRLNEWWWDVLTYGQDSEYQSYFDIDWDEDNGAHGHLGLPVLGSPEDVDTLKLVEDEGDLLLAYYDERFPVKPGTASGIDDDPKAVHDRQAYKLMYWRDGVISYRRFFSVNGLAGLRQEDPRVFEHTHRILAQLLAEGLIDGIRVDHPDGLSYPRRYISQLRNLVGDRWLFIEKILGCAEPLDPRLPVDGTTGYDALREFDGIFINRAAEDALSMLAMQETGSPWDKTAITTTEQQLKREVARDELAAEVNRLVRAIRRDNFSTAGAKVSDSTLTETIIELVAAMPVYRADYQSLSRVTAQVIQDMSERFPSRRDALDIIAAAFLADGEAKVRFAQVCGAVMAKGVEDTTYYRAARLVALQEVGGDPGHFGVSAAEFHLLQSERAQLWPSAMTTLSTHDTKRGEDVRSRIIELSEVPEFFAECVRRVFGMVPPPDGATGHFLLQNLLGIWPENGVLTESLRLRFRDYALKAVREAGLHTTWVDPNEGFESSIVDWIDALFDGLVADTLTTFASRIAPGSDSISLGRKLLQLIGPGVPDIYQGTEFFTDSLVDPDNRRFVDYTARSQALEQTLHHSATPPVPSFLQTPGQDTVPRDYLKQAVVSAALRVRRNHPESFIGGNYQAVFGEGSADSHLIGMARGQAEGVLDVVALATQRPLILEAKGGWGDTTVTLPEGTWVEELTGASFTGATPLPATKIFSSLPIALLTRKDV